MFTSEPERKNSLNHSCTVDYLVDHYLKALEASEVKHQPFSYLFATDLFPSDVYSHLTEAMESVSGFKELKHKGDFVKEGEPLPEPDIWFHDIFRQDGSAYHEKEIAFIKKITPD